MARKTSRRTKKISTSRISRDTASAIDDQSSINNWDDKKLPQSSSVNHVAPEDNIHKDGTSCLCFLRKGLFLPTSEMMQSTTHRNNVIDDSDLKIYDSITRNSIKDGLGDFELKSYDSTTKDISTHHDTKLSSVVDSNFDALRIEGDRKGETRKMATIALKGEL